MMRSLYIAATGMEAQNLNIDVISNNLANVNTNGFKKSRADFQDLLYQTIRTPGATSATGTEIPTGIQVGMGVKPVAVQKIFLQGNFIQTGNSLDTVIQGDGFFQILMPDGTTSYTRAGSFKLDSEGRIVNSDGYPLEPGITVPAKTTSINISSDGIVSVVQAGTTTPTQIGQIELANFINPGGLNALGQNLFQPTASSGDPTTSNPGSNGLGTILQGSLEMSNVNVVEEMVNMIAAQRAYEINSKSIQAADQMLQVANNLGATT
jgi:flagellar basal-body rod protein FlgG